MFHLASLLPDPPMLPWLGKKGADIAFSHKFAYSKKCIPIKSIDNKVVEVESHPIDTCQLHPLTTDLAESVNIKMVLCLSLDTCLESTITILPFISPDWSGKSTSWFPPNRVTLWRMECTVPRKEAKMIVSIAAVGNIMMSSWLIYHNWPLWIEFCVQPSYLNVIKG